MGCGNVWTSLSTAAAVPMEGPPQGTRQLGRCRRIQAPPLIRCWRSLTPGWIGSQLGRYVEIKAGHKGGRTPGVRERRIGLPACRRCVYPSEAREGRQGVECRDHRDTQVIPPLPAGYPLAVPSVNSVWAHSATACNAISAPTPKAIRERHARRRRAHLPCLVRDDQSVTAVPAAPIGGLNSFHKRAHTSA